MKNAGRFLVSSLLVAGMCSAGPLAAGAQESGPQILHLGLLRADDTVVEPSGTDGDGVPIFERPFGSSFSLLVEATRGASGAAVGLSSFSEEGCPDLQVQVSNPLGDGSEAVCDTVPPDDGGVPAIDPPDLGDDPESCDALNDLGCRFTDGSGDSLGRTCTDGCVLFPTGEYGCVDEETDVQFCGRIARSAEFPVGDTLVTARVRDILGNLGAPARLIVRIAEPPPTLTPTSTPLPTPTEDSGLVIKSQGCAVAGPTADRGAGALALLALVALTLRRRRP